MSDKKMALITMAEYKRLVRRDTEFDQLEACGVDNWNGWGQYDDITGEDSEAEIKDALTLCEESLHEIPSIRNVTVLATAPRGTMSLPTVGSHESNPFPSPPSTHEEKDA